MSEIEVENIFSKAEGVVGEVNKFHTIDYEKLQSWKSDALAPKLLNLCKQLALLPSDKKRSYVDVLARLREAIYKKEHTLIRLMGGENIPFEHSLIIKLDLSNKRIKKEDMNIITDIDFIDACS